MALTLYVCDHGSCQPFFLSSRQMRSVGNGKRPRTSRHPEKPAEPGICLTVVPSPSSPLNNSKNEHFCIPEGTPQRQGPRRAVLLHRCGTTSLPPFKQPHVEPPRPFGKVGVPGLPTHSYKTPLPVTSLSAVNSVRGKAGPR